MMKAVIFDLDGTLLNTIDDICYSMNVALSSEGFQTYNSDQMKDFVGSGVKVMVERALGSQKYTINQFENIRKKYMEVYAENQANATKPYDGTIDLLVELKRKGFKIGLLSNKPHQDTLKVVDYYFGLDKFDVVLGQRDGIPVKPDPMGLFEIIDLLHVAKDECIFIGDSDVDMMTANNGGLKKIGVLWGFRTKEVLLSKNADFIVSSASDIVKILEN